MSYADKLRLGDRIACILDRGTSAWSCQEEQLLAVSAERLRPILIVALNTGMRLGEIIGLTWEQVDWARGAIQLTHTKSGRSRAVPMNETVRAVLEPLRGTGVPTGPVFGKLNTVRAQVRLDFDKVREAAKLEGLRFHDLRHTFATRLVTRGVDIVTVSKLLGHSTILMTMRYAHPAPEDLRRAVGRLEKELDPIELASEFKSTRGEGHEGARDKLPSLPAWQSRESASVILTRVTDRASDEVSSKRPDSG